VSVPAAKRFRVLRRLGEGGMGVVYEAVDRESGSRVALKTLRQMTPESLARLKREFRAMQDVHHPNLVSLGELVADGEECFFTMELIDGSDLLDHLQLRPRPPEPKDVPPTCPSPVDVQNTRSSSPPAHLNGAAIAYRFDEARLRSALRQLAEALCALHRAGLVHRDVKSSNVRVARNGRVVLLDFGLVSEAANNSGWTQQQWVGTPAYMAPEQIASGKVGPEADWYAFGVLMFETLTGKLPFEGHAFNIMLRKQKERPPAPASIAPDVPDDLDALCSNLLCFEAAARPRGADVLHVLGAVQDSTSPGSSRIRASCFVGRSAELDVLTSAFNDCRRGQAVTVAVEGESGVGKSALVSRFVHGLAAQWPDTVLLAGRCYGRESVAYKGFDGVVDALARFLSRANSEAEAVLPTRVAPLVKVFPVLRGVAAIAERMFDPLADVPDVALRERAFASLRELFTRLAVRRPLVVVIDDAQWCDPNSLELLAELMRPPEAPPLLLVLTARTPIGMTFATLGQAHLLPHTLKGDVRRVEVGPLPARDAGELASQLLLRTGVTDPQLAEWSVRQADGHPLFIDVIMRRAERYSGTVDTKLVLEDVLWAIVEELDQTARALLELIVVAAAPLPQEVVRRAARLNKNEFAKALSVLRVAHLAHTSGSRSTDLVEPYHDRIIIAVLAHLADARRVECHRRIAVALEISPHPDPEAQFVHWHEAGEAQRAAHYAVVAGDRAGEALAFDRAASLYRLALAGQRIQAPRRDLHLKLAKVLESAGRAESAARAYLDAAEGAAPLRRAELECAAAVALLASGRVDEGTAVLRRVLAAVNIRAPRTTLGALLWLMLCALWLRIVGLRFKERDPDDVRREDRARIDVLFAASLGFILSDSILGWCMTLRHLIAALRKGDRFRLLRASVMQFTSLAKLGKTAGKQERMLASIAAQLAEHEESTEGKAFLEGHRGIQLYLRGHWKAALAALDSAASSVHRHDHEWGWQSNLFLFSCWTLRWLGEYAELARRYARYSADADWRGDIYTAVQLRGGSLAVVWLAADQPAEARRHAREAIGQWSQTRYFLQHWHCMLGEAEIDLYVGDGQSAYARVERDTTPLKRSLLLRAQVVRATTNFLRGRCAIASHDAQPSLASARLNEARRLARKLEGEGMVWTAPLAAILRAATARADGDGEGAATFLRSAIDLAERADMTGYATAARHQLGVLIGGDEGRLLLRNAGDAMASQGVRAPARFAALFVPGRWGTPPGRA
jgi:serine/threonine protein kinase